MSETEGAGPDVTFVGGIAAEQETEGQSNLEAGERSKAIAAVKAAMKGEGEKAAKEAKSAIEQDPLRPRESTERDESGKFTRKPSTPDHESDDDGAAKDATELKKALAERKQGAERQRAWQAQQQREAQALAQQRAQIEHEKRQIAAERQRMELLRKDPVRAIRENGWDPEQFILDIANDGTPEGQKARQEREFRAQVEELRQWKEDQLKQREEYGKRLEEQKQAQYRQTVEQEFIKTALNKEKNPTLAKLYSGKEALLISQGDTIAMQYRQATGKEATFEDIAEYLEEMHSMGYKSDGGTQGTTQNPQVAGSGAQGRPTQGSATGRTLNPGQTGERRTLGTSLKDLDGDERLEAAREAVKHAMRASTER